MATLLLWRGLSVVLGLRCSILALKGPFDVFVLNLEVVTAKRRLLVLTRVVAFTDEMMRCSLFAACNQMLIVLIGKVGVFDRRQLVVIVLGEFLLRFLTRFKGIIHATLMFVHLIHLLPLDSILLHLTLQLLNVHCFLLLFLLDFLLILLVFLANLRAYLVSKIGICKSCNSLLSPLLFNLSFEGNCLFHF